MRDLRRLALLGGFAVFGVACRGQVTEPLSRQIAARPTTATAATEVPAAKQGPCLVAARVNLMLAKQRPDLKAAREQLLRGEPGRAFELARAAGIDLEGASREASLCELSNVGGRSGRVMTFSGDYPDDLLDRIGKTVPGAVMQSSGAGPVLHATAGWLGMMPGRLIWSDTLSLLERGLRGELTDASLNQADLLSVRMTGDRAKNAFAPLTHATGLDAADWDSLVFSVAEDGGRCKIRFVTRSSASATKLLGSVRSILKELASDPHTGRMLAPAGLSVDADGSSVEVRASVPPERLAQLLSTMQPKRGHDHPT